jgi:hypothetical protein
VNSGQCSPFHVLFHSNRASLPLTLTSVYRGLLLKGMDAFLLRHDVLMNFFTPTYEGLFYTLGSELGLSDVLVTEGFKLLLDPTLLVDAQDFGLYFDRPPVSMSFLFKCNLKSTEFKSEFDTSYDRIVIKKESWKCTLNDFKNWLMDNENMGNFMPIYFWNVDTDKAFDLDFYHHMVTPVTPHPIYFYARYPTAGDALLAFYTEATKRQYRSLHRSDVFQNKMMFQTAALSK